MKLCLLISAMVSAFHAPHPDPSRYLGNVGPGEVMPGPHVPGLGRYVRPGIVILRPMAGLEEGWIYMNPGGWTDGVPVESPFLMMPIAHP